MNKWTAEELTILKDNYSGYHKRVYDKLLLDKHSMLSIYKQASKLGLTHKGRKPFIKDGMKVKLTPTQSAYIAGIIDGEGWITVQRNMYYQVGVGNTNLEMLEWLIKTIGEGKLQKRIVDPKYKPRWEVKFNGSLIVRDLLKQIVPYMVIKKNKALEAIEYIENLMR